VIISKNIEEYLGGLFAVADSNPYLRDIFINDVEEKYLKKMLGIDSFIEFKNNLVNGMPQTQKWIDFVEGKVYEVDNVQVDYQGIIDMLQGFIYYEIYKLQNSAQTSIGNQKLDGKNSYKDTYPQNEFDYLKRYNIAIDLMNDAINFLYNNNTKIEVVATSIVDNGNDTYTITSDTTHLLDYSRVNINNKFYTVSDISATNFVISEISGKTFDVNFYFRVYNELKFRQLQRKQQINY